MKVTDRCSTQGNETMFICDFSPPRSADPRALEPARSLDADYINVAYNPGKAVRMDSAMLASSIKSQTGKDAMFNLSTRDMNKVALQSHLLGAQMLGLENVVVLRGDVFTEKDLEKVKDVSDFTPTGLIKSLDTMNQGIDFRGSKLRAPTELCVGGSIDLGRGIHMEAALAHSKAMAGAQFFITQPIFNTDDISAFSGAYSAITGQELTQPVFFGLQILQKDGVIFSSVPEGVRTDLDEGREGTDIALELLEKFQAAGIKRIYLVPPIMKGGARDYEAAQTVLKQAKNR